jgi:hypothetical protein
VQLQKSKPDCQVNVEYPGRIIEGLDNKDVNKGRYLVHIPELMYAIKGEGIYCVNHTHKWRDTYIEERVTDPPVGTLPVGGSYYPLIVGTRVIVKFFAQDCASGYIDRVNSDYYSNSMPLGLQTEQRDDYYQLVRTHKNDLIAISTLDEDTDALPKHSIHIYHNKDHVEVIFNEDGLYISSKEELVINVSKKIKIKTGEILIDSDLCVTGGANFNGVVCANDCNQSFTKCPCYNDGACVKEEDDPTGG